MEVKAKRQRPPLKARSSSRRVKPTTPTTPPPLTSTDLTVGQIATAVIRLNSLIMLIAKETIVGDYTPKSLTTRRNEIARLYIKNLTTQLEGVK